MPTIHLRPEFVNPGGFQTYVKQFIFKTEKLLNFPDDGDVFESIFVQQFNPHKMLELHMGQVAAIHRVIGLMAEAV